MASLTYYYYLVFFLCFHACTTARLLIVSDKQLASKDYVETSAAGSSDRGSNTVQLDNQMLSSVQEGINIKISYASWKPLHQATGTEISRRSTVESSPSNAEENVSSKDNDNVQDIEVMDYAQPHRKPPIHNKGT
ncbi:root meristem growth factor [Perilla frutescens var. frutescens]|nr:root meristem growth factor [Perilla frutescens var. frutescens]